MSPEVWSAEMVLGMFNSYQPACVLAAAVDWDIFSILADAPLSAQDLAHRLGLDSRPVAVLLDSLTAQHLLIKENTLYRLPAGIDDLLVESSPHNILPILRHQTNCLRRWVQLPQVLKTGSPAEHLPSVRGPAADQAAFIGAMHGINESAAPAIIAELGNWNFHHLLDIGGASGTWTIAFLQAAPAARATLFDLPEVIPLARRRLTQAALADRVNLVGGDFYRDALPTGADLVWLSAITHQNSRDQNRDLFAKICAAVPSAGRLLIRDIVMDNSRTQPVRGAMFAVNMLVATEGGGTYTFDEFKADLLAAGFTDITLLRRDNFMNSIISAVKP